jgi:hypothetical protein
MVMSARPTIPSIFAGIVFLALSGPMGLLATVGGENCVDDLGQPVGCEERLTDGAFWLKVEASAISSIAGPWGDLGYLLLPAFGIPALQSMLRQTGAEPAELPESPKTAGPA